MKGFRIVESILVPNSRRKPASSDRNTDHARLLSTDCRNRLSYVRNNTGALSDLPFRLIEKYAGLEAQAAGPRPPIPKAAALRCRSRSPFSRITSCASEDGKQLKCWKRHLKTAYNMTPMIPGSVGTYLRTIRWSRRTTPGARSQLAADRPSAGRPAAVGKAARRRAAGAGRRIAAPISGFGTRVAGHDAIGCQRCARRRRRAVRRIEATAGIPCPTGSRNCAMNADCA